MKAVLKNGIIHPKEPIPGDWSEGTELDVAKSPADVHTDDLDEWCVDSTDAWMDKVEAIAAQGNPEDDKRLDDAIQEIRRREKDLTRRRQGSDR